MKFTKTLLAAGLLALGSAAHATTLTFDDTTLGGDNIFDFDSISLLSFETSVTLTDSNGDGTLLGAGDFTEIGLTGTVSFNTESGGTQVPINPLTTGLNTEYQLFFDLTVMGTAEFNILGPGALQGLINFDNAMSSVDFYYDTDLNPGLQLGTSTLLSSDSLVGSNACQIFSSNTVAAGDVLGSCLLNSEFSPIAGVFSDGGVDLNSLIGSVPLITEFDINVDEFIPALQFVFPGGAGSSQTFSVQHDGSARFVVPEPSSIAILALGLIGLGAAGRRKKS